MPTSLQLAVTSHPLVLATLKHLLNPYINFYINNYFLGNCRAIARMNCMFSKSLLSSSVSLSP